MGALIEDPSHPTELTLSHKKAAFCFWGLTGGRENFASNRSTAVTVILGHFFYSHGRGDFFSSPGNVVMSCNKHGMAQVSQTHFPLADFDFLYFL